MSELAQPFSLSPSGGVAVVSDPGTITQQHLQALVSTAPGERVMQPRYGVPLASFLFGADAAATDAVIAADIRAAIITWEPSVALQDVQTTVADTTLGIASIDVQYSPGAGVGAQAQVQTATVLVGGAVV